MFGISCWVVALAFLVVPGFSSAAEASRDLADRAERKFRYLDQNAQHEHPDSRPTVLTEAEVNAYLASGKVRFPAGVESLRLVGTSGMIAAHCRVDFDKVRAGRANTNPLLRLFSGVHDVNVEALASGSNRKGRVHVNSVAIDGIVVPRFVLQLFVDKYVTARYPGVGLDSVFALPDKIDTATVGSHKLIILQR
jgi:hypothetical protein